MNAIGASSSYAASLGRIPCWSENRASAREPIVGGLARRIADGNVPQSLAEKAILALDLPPLRALEKDRSWQERLDRALLAAAEDGKVFFVNRMHDRPGGVSPIASIHVTELLQRPIIAGKIQCISPSSPATFTNLQADGHWLAQYFEPIEVAPANEETAIKVLRHQGRLRDIPQCLIYGRGHCTRRCLRQQIHQEGLLAG